MSCRRATADTLAPGAKLSATIAAFTSVDQRRRRPVPVTISTRRSVSAPLFEIRRMPILIAILTTVLRDSDLATNHSARSSSRPDQPLARGPCMTLTFNRHHESDGGAVLHDAKGEVPNGF